MSSFAGRIRLGVCAAPFVLASSIGCGSGTGPGDGTRWERRVGVIEHFGDSVRIALPDSVTIDQEFQITVTTYGGGCTRQADTEVVIEALVAHVTPFDSVAVELPPNEICTQPLLLYAHEATLRFDSAGEALVQVHGWTRPAETELIVGRPVVVR